MLKIMGGSARGRAVRTPPKTPLVRPILARVKKSVFDILRPRLEGSRFLDIYAGSGAVGLEALSRGAAQVHFVEHDRMCAKLIQENLDHLGFSDKGRVFRYDAIAGLGSVSGPYELIFMGPPYKAADKTPLALVHPTLEAIATHSLLAPGGWIIAQHHKKEAVGETPVWRMFRREEYGDTVVSFFDAVA